MTRWWDSIMAMRRLAHGLASAAGLLFLIGIGTLADAININISIAALVLGTPVVLCALFAWFRLEHLRELDRLGR